MEKNEEDHKFVRIYLHIRRKESSEESEYIDEDSSRIDVQRRDGNVERHPVETGT